MHLPRLSTLPLPCALLLLAGCASTSGSFPSLLPRAGEMERVIAAPGEGVTAALPDEQRASLKADLQRERALLEATEADMKAAGAALDRALAAARGQARGSEGWSNAQMALSRYDLARTPLGEIEARLAPLQRSIDSLPAGDADRQAVEALAARTRSTAAAGQLQVDAANRALGA